MRQRTFVHFGQPAYSPFTTFARELEKEFNRSFEAPQLLETDDAFLASFDIPGVNFSDINIEVEDERLTLSAERKNPFDKTGELTKKYNQVFSLPKNIEHEKISAHYENGVLSLTIPKLLEAKTKKKIQVLTGEKPKSWTNFLSFGKHEAENAVN